MIDITQPQRFYDSWHSLALEFNVCSTIVIMMLARVPRDLLLLFPKVWPTLEAGAATKCAGAQ